MTDTLASALLAAQADFPSIQKNAVNPHFKNRYVSLDNLMGHVLPVLNKHGLVLLQTPSHLDGAPALRTRLWHAASGEHVEDTMPLLLDRENAQGVGSALTYARRYALMAMLGLVADEDDDANLASAPRMQPQAQPTYSTGAAPAGAPIRAATGGDTSMVFAFGKNKGRTLADVYAEDPKYVSWVAFTMEVDTSYPDRVAFRDAARALCQADQPFGDMDPDADSIPFR